MKLLSINILKKIFKRDLYNIGIVDGDIHGCLFQGWPDNVKWYKGKLKTGQFLADPFGVEIEGYKYIICEYFDYREPYGKIVSISVNEKGEYGDIKELLGLNTHLSYPYIIKDKQNVYCIPESGMEKRLDLFCIKGPHISIKKIKTIKDNVSAYDPCVLKYDNKWWILYSDKEGNNLYIMFSDELCGEWKEHEKNPVIKDKGLTRSGGTIFEYNDALYRPIQDCRYKYGEKIIVKKIIKLSTNEYEEEYVKEIIPIKDGLWPDGIHTVSSFYGKTLIDGKKEIFIFAALLRSIKKYFNILDKRIV